MSEYSFVERPFLEQLKRLEWNVIEHSDGIPTDPAVSLRDNFREVVLKDVFKQAIKHINKTEDGREWLTDAQLEEIYTELIDHPHQNLLEANQEVLRLLTQNTRVAVNELTGEESPVVRLIDFEHHENNHFLAVNQFRVDTVGLAKAFIIPDIVLFINGLPVVVVECKYPNSYTANPMEEAVRQILRYSNRRCFSEGISEKEGEERLFHFNQLCIATCGEQAKLGSISSFYEHYLEWKDIYPDEYKNFEPPLGAVRSQETLIQGVLPPATLLDVIRHFIIFMETEKGSLVKVVCRYQQQRAVGKAIARMLEGKKWQERSGVIWHTQGSGKSLTMVFLIRKMRSTKGLSDYKILMVNDRVDLEEQLGDTAVLTGESVDYVECAEELKEKLSASSSNLTMVMIHKFQERKKEQPAVVKEAFAQYGEGNALPEYVDFGTVNTSEKILILIDEAHRTQKGILSGNLFGAFPNATKIAFTGTPLITDRHTKKTYETFGAYIDTYRLQDAVTDGATVKILYEGKTSDNAINEKAEFDAKFEDMFKERTEEEMLAIKKKYGTMGDVLEAEKRIDGIARDLVNHYIQHILPNGFKAQVVTSSQLAATRYQKYIDLALVEWLEKERAKAASDEELVQKVAFLKTAVVVSGDGTNEDPEITKARKASCEIKAIDNFKKKFDESDSRTGIAFIVVCDMLLTGFDAPIEQVMYIDKKMVEHNLLQAIARVNRTASGKKCGYVVDYIGIGNHLYDALQIYGDEGKEDVIGAMKDISSEVPILEERYQRLLQLFCSNGISRIRELVEYQIVEAKEQYPILEACVELLEDIKLRADFDVKYKGFLQSMDIILPHASATPYIPMMKAFGHIHNLVKQRYKDESIDFAGVGNKVKRLINEHLISLGIDPRVPPVELLSPDFKKSLDKEGSKKAKASEMEHAIRKHCKVSFESDPALYARLSEKLEKIIQEYKDDTNQRYEQLLSLFDEVKAGRTGSRTNLPPHEEAFYDLLVLKVYGKTPDLTEEQSASLQTLVHTIIQTIATDIKIVGFWTVAKGFERQRLQSKVEDLLLFSGMDEVVDLKEGIAADFLALAKQRHDELVRK